MTVSREIKGLEKKLYYYKQCTTKGANAGARIASVFFWDRSQFVSWINQLNQAYDLGMTNAYYVEV